MGSPPRIIKIDTRRCAKLRPLFSFLLSFFPFLTPFVPTHVASAPFLSEAFGKIEYADDRLNSTAVAAGPRPPRPPPMPPTPPPAMQTKFGATGKIY